MIDVWSSAGVRLSRQIPTLEDMPLPMDDVIFLSLKHGDYPPSRAANSTTAASSLLAQMVKLHRILLEINSLNERTVSGATSGVTLENEVMDLSNALDEWHASLPPSMHDMPSNLQRYVSQGLGRIVCGSISRLLSSISSFMAIATAPF